LKGVNILITHEHKACLADFGLASVEDSQAVALSSISGGRTTGTSRWQAPELLDPPLIDLHYQGKNSPASDIYSFACVCYEIYSGNIPFHEIANDSRVILSVIRGERPSRPPHDSRQMCYIFEPVVWELIDACWAEQPQERPTASEIVKRFYTRTQTHLSLEHSAPRANSTYVNMPTSTSTSADLEDVSGICGGTGMVATTPKLRAAQQIGPRWSGTTRVLLIDHDELTRTVSEKLLRSLGCTVGIAFSGAAAAAIMTRTS